MEEDNTCVSAFDLPLDSASASSEEKARSPSRERCTSCNSILRKAKRKKDKNKEKRPLSAAQDASLQKARAVRAEKLLQKRLRALAEAGEADHKTYQEAMEQDEIAISVDAVGPVVSIQ